MPEHPVGPVALRAELARLLSPGSDFQSQMRRKADRLARVTGSKDADDQFQDLSVRLLSAFRRYDPGKGSLSGFLSSVMDGWYAEAARRVKRRRIYGSLDDAVARGEQTEPARGPREPAGLDALVGRLDLDLAISRLPVHLRPLARLLRERSASEVARAAGVHRATVWRRFRELRASLTQILRENQQESCNVPTQPAERS